MKTLQEWVRKFILPYPHPVSLILFLILLSWPVLEAAQEIGIYFSQKTQIRDLEQAKSVWDRRPFSRYRLMIDFSFGSSALPHFFSQQIIEVDGERVLGCQQIFEKQITQTCELPTLVAIESPVTITSIFDNIEMAIGKRDCGSNGCRCNSAVHLDVAYDFEHGYPTRLSRIARNDWKAIPWPPLLFFSVCQWHRNPPPHEVTVSLTPS